ncbi:MAG: membrane protein insertase YidC [Variovorax sp.]
MNDIRRTILWVIFGFSLVMLWDQWQLANGHKPIFLPTPRPTVAANAPVDGRNAGATSSAAGIDRSVPSATATGAGTGAGSDTAGALPMQGAGTAAAPSSERVTVTTDVFHAEIDSQGATLADLQLLKYADQATRSKFVTLMENDSPADRYLVQTGLINVAGGGAAFPNHLSAMTPRPGPRELQRGQDTLEVAFESAPAGGLRYVKTYVFHRGEYLIGVRHEIVNTGEAPRTAQLYLQFLRHGTVKSGTMFGTNTFTGPAFYTDEKKFHKVNFKEIEDKKAELPPASDNGWVAMVQHYFVAAWLIDGGASGAASSSGASNTKRQREFRTASLGNNLYSAAMVLPLQAIDPGASRIIETSLYAGPEEERKLEQLAPGLELVKDYGIFTIIAKPLYWLLKELHTFIGNWGWSIVALVVCLKAAFYWLNAKAYASMAKMKGINPKITEMRERLKGQPKEMQQEMMRIYREEKVNPMGGCFPIVIQIPVFIALYWVLLSSVEMRNAPWIGWIHDLSSPDPLYILPVVMTATSLFQTWLNPKPPDPMQARLMWMMPLVFSVMFVFFPAGLVLYWITNNILSIAQQWFINKRLGVLGK